MEELCPQACCSTFPTREPHRPALSRYTGLSFAGLCHGICMGYDSIAQITGLPRRPGGRGCRPEPL
jgi:hypothetical protein